MTDGYCFGYHVLFAGCLRRDMKCHSCYSAGMEALPFLVAKVRKQVLVPRLPVSCFHLDFFQKCSVMLWLLAKGHNDHRGSNNQLLVTALGLNSHFPLSLVLSLKLKPNKDIIASKICCLSMNILTKQESLYWNLSWIMIHTGAWECVSHNFWWLSVH